MITLETGPLTQLLLEKEEITSRFNAHGINYKPWGTGTSRTLEHLLTSLKKNHMFLVERPHGIQLHVHNAVAIVQHVHKGRLMELHEKYQEFHVSKQRLVRGFRGVAETLNRDEVPLIGIYRALTEELVALEPRFKEHWRYSLTHLDPELDGPKGSEKWPGLTAYFHRNLYHCLIVDEELYREDGYVEEQEEKTTVFEWREVPKNDKYRLPFLP